MASKTPEMERLKARGLTKISLQLPIEAVEDIDRIAAKDDISRSEAIVQAIDDYRWRNR